MFQTSSKAHLHVALGLHGHHVLLQSCNLLLQHPVLLSERHHLLGAAAAGAASAADRARRGPPCGPVAAASALQAGDCSSKMPQALAVVCEALHACVCKRVRVGVGD